MSNRGGNIESIWQGPGACPPPDDLSTYGGLARLWQGYTRHPAISLMPAILDFAMDHPYTNFDEIVRSIRNRHLQLKWMVWFQPKFPI